MKLADRFWSKVDRRGEDECWPWIAGRSGGRGGESYGTLRVGSLKDDTRRQEYAHRIAFCLDRGIDIDALPDGVVIRHSCDFGLCCNPRHLLDGTQADNMLDMIERGRSRRGELAPGAILTESSVRAIKARLAASEFHHVIAADYGVGRAAISNINTGRSWAWV
jgi:hypothetical protein